VLFKKQSLELTTRLPVKHCEGSLSNPGFSIKSSSSSELTIFESIPFDNIESAEDEMSHNLLDSNKCEYPDSRVSASDS